MKPQTLDHAGIAAQVPHSGTMCLLDRLLSWSAESICCAARSHHNPSHPLAMHGALWSPCAIEYAAQAMALHGTLCAAPGATPTPGMLASVRAVRLLVPRLDLIEGELVIAARKQAGDSHSALYRFTLHDERGALLVDGRATVILNTPPGVPRHDD